MSKNRHPAKIGEKSGGHRRIYKACDVGFTRWIAAFCAVLPSSYHLSSFNSSYVKSILNAMRHIAPFTLRTLLYGDDDLDLTENKRFITETLRFINDSKKFA